jgi:adenosine deaminase CECR1
MRTKVLPFSDSAQTALKATPASRCRARSRWLAFLIIAVASAAHGLAQTSFRTHTTQKHSYLTNSAAFEADRQRRIAGHQQARFCADEMLTDQEQRVAARLREHVAAYFESNRKSKDFGPTLPFYAAKAEITTNDAFQLLRKMPKGALLHAHLTAVGRMDWVITNALTLSNCYVYWPADDPRARGHLKFMTPQEAATNANYFLVSQVAAAFDARNGTFAEALRAALTLGADDANTGRRAWEELGSLFGRTGDFIRYRPIFTNYLLDAFQTLWDDGVYYVELRDSLGTLNGPNPPDDLAKEYIDQFKAARDMMKAKHPQFDCRLIISDFRGRNGSEIANKLKDAVLLRDQHTNLIAGFDLIGEEIGQADFTTRAKVADVQRKIMTNSEYKDLIEKLPHADLPYFLHDGESAEADNENLIDAVLLGTPRIGHAFNLYRYPSLYPLIKSRDIALEICPISNQLLGLSPDLRTHPAAGYLNAGIQCTLSSDDPLWFGNDGLSYDYWEALMAWNLDLAALKKLARNSITYSGLDAAPKARLIRHWEQEWDKFIRRLAQEKPQL